MAPHKSINVPSRNIFDLVDEACLVVDELVDKHGVKRDSLRLKTAPHTLTSIHSPTELSSAMKPSVGCIIKTPFVVTPSISPLSFFHLVAFSYLNEIK